MALDMSASRPSDDDVVGGGEGIGSGAGDSHGRPRELMFEKVVTPSDVGKLNRLVVPKHLAEKHLPLHRAARAAGGTVLCFHDARGGSQSPASWRFRYSYWSSSQSYVMTKGWSRYVRDKRLAAGDTVCFSRDGPNLFIDCRRRRITRKAPPPVAVPQQQQQAFFFFPHQAAVQPQQQQDCLVVAMEEEDQEEAQRLRRRRPSCLRLFGVNLELDHHQLRAEPLLLDLQL